MAKLGISTGTTPNDGTGDSLLAGAVKVNSNFTEVYGIIGDGSSTFVGIVSSIAVSGPLSISTSYGAPTITGLANTAVISAEPTVLSPRVDTPVTLRVSALITAVFASSVMV